MYEFIAKDKATLKQTLVVVNSLDGAFFSMFLLRQANYSLKTESPASSGLDALLEINTWVNHHYATSSKLVPIINAEV